MKAGFNVISSKNPLIITKNITLVVVDCCTPPALHIIDHCMAGPRLITVAVIAPSSVTFGSAVHVIGEIYDNC